MIDTTINRGLVRSGAGTSYKNYRQQPKPLATVRERERDYNYRQHPCPLQALRAIQQRVQQCFCSSLLEKMKEMQSVASLRDDGLTGVKKKLNVYSRLYAELSN